MDKRNNNDHLHKAQYIEFQTFFFNKLNESMDLNVIMCPLSHLEKPAENGWIESIVPCSFDLG